MPQLKVYRTPHLRTHQNRTILHLRIPKQPLPTLLLLLLHTRLRNLSPLPIPHHIIHALTHAILHPKRQTPQSRRNNPRRLRQRHMLTLSRKHRLDNLVRHRFGEQELGIEALEERGARVALAHEHGAHFGRFVVRDEFGAETLVEGHGGGLGSCVVDHGGRGDVACQTGDGDDHAVVVGDHVWQELLGEVVVREGVDLEGQVDVELCGFEDRLAAHDTRVVDQHGGVAHGGADLGGGGGDGFGGGEVALEVADRWGR
jgi:hypothetical protein